jgi:PAS domain S-box-containing protein
MSLYSLVPLVSCIVLAVLASAILTRDSARATNRIAAALVAGATVWSFCEVLWNTGTDPRLVLVLVKASSLGWVWIGPLTLHLFLELTGRPMPRVRRSLPALYCVSAGFLAVDWATPWIHPRVMRADWGWAYALGPAYPWFYVFTVTCLALALRAAARAYRTAPSPGEREQARWVSIGIFIPLVVGSATDGLLPLAGVQVPRFGTASFAVLAFLILWSSHRYGYSVLATGDFASEILETLPDGVAMLRLDGTVYSANGAMARLVGAEPTALVGLRLTDRLSEPLHPTGEPAERQCQLATLSGRRVPVAISSALLRDKRGSPLGLVLVVRDLAEVVSLRDRLILARRLAAVGELAAGIAHEINNPLAFVRANLSLLRQHWAALGVGIEKAGSAAVGDVLAEGEELLDESLEGVDRASAIVRDVRGLAHGGSRARAIHDVHDLLEGVLRMAAPQLRRCATVEKHYGETAPVSCAPEELQQVFLNLVLNAGQAIADSGTIRIVTERMRDLVVVHVEDDGCGIESENLERIFDPFFTTKAVGEGTGLGLGIAYGIVRNHGGYVAVASRPGSGTRVSVHLPVAASPAA